jgi:hypothetical protein
MKTPKDLASRMDGQKANPVIRETMRISRTEVQRRLKLVFREYPTASYLTEIEAMRELADGTVQLTVKRKSRPISG